MGRGIASISVHSRARGHPATGGYASPSCFPGFPLPRGRTEIVSTRGGPASRHSLFALLLLLLLLYAGPALAHGGDDAFGGFIGGFRHPFLGLDHMAAMVAVGLWGAFLGAPALWMLPIIFPLIMALGGIAGLAGLDVPGVERGIAGSAVVLGLVVALAMRAPMWFAAAMVGVFALFHGFAHGRELPAGADAVGFFTGFVIATGLLHLAGIGIGSLARGRAGVVAVRAMGGAIALIGAAFLLTAP